MSYQPLARKYRPAKFSDLIGQDSVSKALAGAIKLDRLHPSIIFSGVRGIGKTTIARLLAKALCCDEGASPEPCDICVSCKAITAGNHEDVLEIDGASNNGVDEVRALRETVNYIPQRSKYKIYIIDEVHMLSTSAFNALLKTLEEPPPNVIFIFATTELHKVPATVAGRCLTFNLKKITNADIVKRVEYILEKEKIPYEEKALAVVAREGHGSMRDALTFLDQVIAIGEGKVDLESLKGVVSSLSSEPFLLLLEALIKKDGHRCIELVENLDNAGVVFSDVTEGLAVFARHGFVLKGLGRKSVELSMLGLTEDEIISLCKMGDLADVLDFNRIFRMIHSCQKELDGSDLDRFTLENCLLEWCFDPGFPDINTLLSGNDNNQKIIQSLAPANINSKQQELKPNKSISKSFMADLKKDIASPSARAMNAEKNEVKKTEVINTEKKLEEKSQQFPETWRSLVDAWKKFKPLQARKLEEVHPIKYSSKEIVVAVDDTGLIGREILKEANQRKLEATFSELFSFRGRFQALAKSSVDPALLEEFDKLEENRREPIQNVSEPVTDEIEEIKEGDCVDESQLPESIEQTKFREIKAERKSIIENAQENNLTQSLLKEFEGKIVDIKITDPSMSDFYENHV